MATKLEKKSANSKPSAPDKGADDLSVMYPDVTVTIAGREITVREYRFEEGLRIRALMRPFTADLDRLFTDGEALVEDVADLTGEHIDLVRQAIAQSAGVEPEWIAGLNDADGDLLLNVWWGVCGSFFIRQVVRRAAERARRAAFAGATLSTSSPAPTTAAPTSSAGNTPNASSGSSPSAPPPAEPASSPT